MPTGNTYRRYTHHWNTTAYSSTTAEGLSTPVISSMGLKSLLVAICLLLTLQGTVGAPTKDNNCCLPEQFENKLVSSLGMVVPKFGPQGSMLNGTMHADFTNQRWVPEHV